MGDKVPNRYLQWRLFSIIDIVQWTGMESRYFSMVVHLETSVRYFSMGTLNGPCQIFFNVIRATLDLIKVCSSAMPKAVTATSSVHDFLRFLPNGADKLENRR